MKKLFSIIFFSLLPLLSFAQSVKQEIDSVEIYIGCQAHLKVTVMSKKGQKVEMPIFKENQYITPGVEVLDNGEETVSEQDNNSVETIRQYTLTSFDDTLYYIPPVKVKVDGKEFEGKSLALKVLTLDVDTLHPEIFFPPQDVQNPPFELSDWTDIILLSSIALLLFVLCAYFYKRRKENKPLRIRFPFRRKLTPYEQALKDINTLKDKGVTHSENQKDYYSALTDTLRSYLESRFGFNAKEMITSEIIDALKKQENATMINELKQLFETADLVKFAKFVVPLSENDQNLANALQFVANTKPEEKQQEEKKPQKSEAEKQKILWRRIYTGLIAAFAIVGSLLIAWSCWLLINLL